MSLQAAAAMIAPTVAHSMSFFRDWGAEASIAVPIAATRIDPAVAWYVSRRANGKAAVASSQPDLQVCR
jgi:hypothetical protein